MLTISERALEALVDMVHRPPLPPVGPQNPGDDSVAARTDRLKVARQRVYATAEAAAVALGMKGVTVRAHENGQNGFSVPDANRYAAAYGVSLEWLLTGAAPQGEAGFWNAQPDAVDATAAATLAQRVQERLTATGKSANLASLEAGLSRDFVRTIIDGRSRAPSYKNLQRLAAVLGCDPAHLASDPTP